MRGSAVRLVLCSGVSGALPLMAHPQRSSRLSAMRKNTYVAVGMLLAAILIALALFRPSAPVIVGVGFLGYTNGVTGERFARFGLTNESGVMIRRWGHFDREVRNSPSLAYTRTLGSHVLLPAGQAEVILVPLDAEPAADYQTDWRAVFYWRREDLKTRFDIWAYSPPSLKIWLPTWLQRDGIPVHAAPSEWMDQ